jgi:hypothetical protein
MKGIEKSSSKSQAGLGQETLPIRSIATKKKHKNARVEIV